MIGKVQTSVELTVEEIIELVKKNYPELKGELTLQWTTIKVGEYNDESEQLKSITVVSKTK